MSALNVLTGGAVTAGLDAAALGIEFAPLPEGEYPVGAEDDPDTLPAQIVNIEEPIDISTTPVTNAQYAAGLAQLEGRDTVLMAQLPGDQLRVIARGRSAEINSMSSSDIRRAVEDSVTLAGLRGIEGGLKAFNLDAIVQQVVDVGPVTLAHRLNQMREVFRGPNKPVVLVSFWEAAAFAALFGLRLPTEVEWEAAARGKKGHEYGTSTGELYDANGKKLAHFHKRSTADVKSYPPSELGFYDMAGNVWEWTQSLYRRGGSIRVLRSGSWSNVFLEFLRAAYRNDGSPDIRFDYYGFRVARVPRGSKKPV